jgi:hypothetical protein
MVSRSDRKELCRRIVRLSELVDDTVALARDAIKECTRRGARIDQLERAISGIRKIADIHGERLIIDECNDVLPPEAAK